MSTSIKLDSDEKCKSVDIKLYKSMIDSLLYLTASRPDIMFSVCLCARFQSNPKESHVIVVKNSKRIFHYLKHTPNLGICYPRGTSFNLIGYTNAGYSRSRVDRKRTSGSC